MLEVNTGFPSPQGGASLLLSFRLQDQTVLVVGSGLLAAARAFAALEADSHVIIIAKGGLKAACEEIQWRANQRQLKFVDWDSLPLASTSDVDAMKLFLDETCGISLACITDTLVSGQRRSVDSAERLYRLFQTRRIPVNITDIPHLCDFTFTTAHRFENPETGQKTPLQIGVTTNGQGCRLAGRLRRDIVSKLPKEVGLAVEKVGQMRAQVKASAVALDDLADDELSEDNGVTTPNRPVPARIKNETPVESARRRMKWVAQVSEYWPISKLSHMTEKDLQEVVTGSIESSQTPGEAKSIHSLTISRPGRILLVGSGPGHPALLTIATHTALTKLADLVLSDKLVPDAVLALIPKHVEVRIAKKFPGNAEASQMEMMKAAVEAAKRGLTVVRVSLSSRDNITDF